VFNGQTYNDVTSTHTITGLAPDTQYSYSLTAYRDDNDYIDSSPATGTVTTTALTQLATPDNITTSNITDTSFELNWDASEGAEQYRVQINGTDHTTSATTYTATGLTHDSTQSWELQAIDTDGSHQNSKYRTGQVDTLQTRLPQPTVTQSDLTYNSITISWTPDPRATHYEVFISGEEGSGVPSDTNLMVTDGTYTSSNLTPEIDYSWLVRAKDSTGTYLQSIDLFGYFTTPADTRPTTGAFTVEEYVEDTSITLSWTHSTWADRYLIQCWLVQANGTLTSVYEEYHYDIYNNDRVHTIPDLQYDQNYKWSVQAQDTDAGSNYQGFQPETRTGTFTTAFFPTPRIAHSFQVVYVDGIKIAWFVDDHPDTGDEVTAYDIYWSNQVTGSGGAHTIPMPGGSNLYTISNLAIHEPYSVGIRARSNKGESAYRVQNITTGKILPPDIEFFDVTPTSFKIMLTTDSMDYNAQYYGVKLNGASSFNSITGKTNQLTSSQISTSPFSPGDDVELEVQQMIRTPGTTNNTGFLNSDLVTFYLTLPYS